MLEKLGGFVTIVVASSGEKGKYRGQIKRRPYQIHRGAEET
jgi:hypothetical protein